MAVFPQPYSRYVQLLAERDAAGDGGARADAVAYRVRSGDSLWEIAQRHGVTVEELRSMNGLRSSTIFAGQTLRVPSRR